MYYFRLFIFGSLLVSQVLTISAVDFSKFTDLFKKTESQKIIDGFKKLESKYKDSSYIAEYFAANEKNRNKLQAKLSSDEKNYWEIAKSVIDLIFRVEDQLSPNTVFHIQECHKESNRLADMLWQQSYNIANEIAKLPLQASIKSGVVNFDQKSVDDLSYDQRNFLLKLLQETHNNREVQLKLLTRKKCDIYDIFKPRIQFLIAFKDSLDRNSLLIIQSLKNYGLKSQGAVNIKVKEIASTFKNLQLVSKALGKIKEFFIPRSKESLSGSIKFKFFNDYNDNVRKFGELVEKSPEKVTYFNPIYNISKQIFDDIYELQNIFKDNELKLVYGPDSLMIETKSLEQFKQNMRTRKSEKEKRDFEFKFKQYLNFIHYYFPMSYGQNGELFNRLNKYAETIKQDKLSQFKVALLEWIELLKDLAVSIRTVMQDPLMRLETLLTTNK